MVENLSISTIFPCISDQTTLETDPAMGSRIQIDSSSYIYFTQMLNTVLEDDSR